MDCSIFVLAEQGRPEAKVGLEMTEMAVGVSRQRRRQLTVCHGWVEECRGGSPCGLLVVQAAAVRCLAAGRAAGGSEVAAVEGSAGRLLRRAPRGVSGLAEAGRIDCWVCDIGSRTRLAGRQRVTPATGSAAESWRGWVGLVEETAALWNLVVGTAAAETEEKQGLGVADPCAARSRVSTGDSGQPECLSLPSCPCPSVS